MICIVLLTSLIPGVTEIGLVLISIIALSSRGEVEAMEKVVTVGCE